MTDRPLRRRRPILVGILLELSLGLIATGLGKLTGTPVERFLSGGFEDLLYGSFAAIPMMLVFGLLQLVERFSPVAEIRRVLDELLVPFLRGSTFLERLGLCAAAGLGEELLFRGLIQSWLTAALGPVPGLLLGGLLFGLAHPITRLYVVLATLFGVYLGWVWIASGNLLVPVVAHGLYDLAALEWLLRRDPPPAAGSPIDSDRAT
jgi:membrane protease YdiL (CAAX protease family)